MNKQMVLLVEALEQAAAADDWERVQQIDRRLHSALTEMRSQRASGVNQHGLAQLQQRHAQVVAACRQRMDELRTILRQHQGNKEGIQAYARFSLEENS